MASMTEDPLSIQIVLMIEQTPAMPSVPRALPQAILRGPRQRRIKNLALGVVGANRSPNIPEAALWLQSF